MKTCFVVMGFGKKFDYKNRRTVNLDDVYNRVIKRVFETRSNEYRLVRADEIISTTLIDVNMYNLLMSAELVIADLTTYNPNAVYELGIRHALRPYSTILMIEKNNDLVFDLNHTSTLIYPEIREGKDNSVVKSTIDQLGALVDSCQTQQTDSPFYTFMPNVSPPKLRKENEEDLKDRLQIQSEKISDLLIEAQHGMDLGEFQLAFVAWEKMSKILPNNEYFIQQKALSKYKSRLPNETDSLMSAFLIIESLDPDNSLDPETLGIAGAINKRLYHVNSNIDYLNSAIKFYKKGFILKNDYYDGENYVNCLLLKLKDQNVQNDERVYIKYESEQVTQIIIDIVLDIIKKNDNKYWEFATLAACYLLMGDKQQYEKFESLFLKNAHADWEKQTYQSTIELRKEISK